MVREVLEKQAKIAKRAKSKGERIALTLSHGISGNTGMAKTTRHVSEGLVAAGWKVYNQHIHYHGMPLENPKGFDGITILPNGVDQWGQDILPYYIDTLKPDVLWTLADIWNYVWVKDIPRKHEWYHCNHYPIDTENVTDSWLNNIRSWDIPVASSKFSYDIIKSRGVDTHYIPDGFNPKHFFPVNDAKKGEFKEKYGFAKDDWVVLCVAHNQFRKKLYILLEAFARFWHSNGRPPNAKLLLHCAPVDASGWNLPELARELRITSQLRFTDKASKNYGDIHVNEKQVAELYNLCDVHALPTGGEGVGLPFIESMACGKPNIATEFTTPKEFFADNVDGKLVPKRGILVPVCHVEHHHSGGLWGIADTMKFAQALKYAFENGDKMAEMGQEATKFAYEHYQWPRIQKVWVKVLNEPERYVLNKVKHQALRVLGV